MRRITSFDDGENIYPLTYVQSLNDNFGDAVPRFQRVIGAHGAFDELGVSPAPAEVGNVQAQVVLFVTDTTQMTAKIDTLRKMSRGSKGFLYMTVEDGSVRWCKARVNNVSTPINEDSQSGLIVRADVSFQVSDPHWYRQGTEAPTWSNFYWGDAYWGGTATQHAVSGVSTDFTEAVADGSIATQPRLFVVCGAGQTAENVKIQRLVDSVVVDEVLYTGVLTAGDQLKVNPRGLSVLLNGNDAFDDLSWVHRRWFRLEPGDNAIRVIMENSGDAATVSLNYYYKWV